MSDGISCLHFMHSKHKSITDYVQVNKVFSSVVHKITSLLEIFYFLRRRDFRETDKYIN